MCTAILWKHYFGRTLDYELSFGEQVVLVPRRMPLQFCIKPPLERHYALLGMASVQQGVPLFFDAMNEKGLAMAGLQFAEYADYSKKGSIAPFELISWVLGQCADLAQARQLLRGQELCNIAFFQGAAQCAAPLDDRRWERGIDFRTDGRGAAAL